MLCVMLESQLSKWRTPVASANEGGQYVALAAGGVRRKGILRREGKEGEGKECKWWLHKSRTEAITWLKALCSEAAAHAHLTISCHVPKPVLVHVCNYHELDRCLHNLQTKSAWIKKTMSSLTWLVPHLFDDSASCHSIPQHQ